MIDEPCDGCGNTAFHALCDQCVDDDVEREAKLLAECRAECERQTKYGIAQHEATQEAIRERDAALAEVKRITHNIVQTEKHCQLLEQENAALRRWQYEVADSIGYLNRPEGQSGYEVAEAGVVVQAFKQMERRGDAAADTCDALLLRVDALTSALRGLLLSRDASWTGGHDWQEAVNQACRALGVEPGDE